MMWAPMPEKYSATDGRTLVLIPEESDEEEKIWQEALAASSKSAGALPPAQATATASEMHYEIDDGTIVPIKETESVEDPDED